ncbi:MAG: hypothetical protein R3C11_19360 [Planctomycetaceae bacterium]
MLPARTKMNRVAQSLNFADDCSDVYEPSQHFRDAHLAHSIEREVHHALLTTPGLKIHSLVIHRIPDGICLDGTIELEQPLDNPCELITALIQKEVGVNRVVNRMVTCNPFQQCHCSSESIAEESLEHV